MRKRLRKKLPAMPANITANEFDCATTLGAIASLTLAPLVSITLADMYQSMESIE